MPNDYKNAINAYDKSNKGGLSDPREVEARALLKSAQNMQNIKETWPEGEKDLDETLTKNRQLWSIFVASMEQSPDIPFSLRANIANLGIYTFKRTFEILADPNPTKLDVLINLNRNIAAGLIESVANSKANAPAAPQATAPSPYAGNTTSPEHKQERPSIEDLDLDI